MFLRGWSFSQSNNEYEHNLAALGFSTLKIRIFLLNKLSLSKLYVYLINQARGPYREIIDPSS